MSAQTYSLQMAAHIDLLRGQNYDVEVLYWRSAVDRKKVLYVFTRTLHVTSMIIGVMNKEMVTPKLDPKNKDNIIGGCHDEFYIPQKDKLKVCLVEILKAWFSTPQTIAAEMKQLYNLLLSKDFCISLIFICFFRCLS